MIQGLLPSSVWQHAAMNEMLLSALQDVHLRQPCLRLSLKNTDLSPLPMFAITQACAIYAGVTQHEP